MVYRGVYIFEPPGSNGGVRATPQDVSSLKVYGKYSSGVYPKMYPKI
jgi:hypothetical protein